MPKNAKKSKKKQKQNQKKYIKIEKPRFRDLARFFVLDKTLVAPFQDCPQSCKTCITRINCQNLSLVKEISYGNLHAYSYNIYCIV